MAEKRKDNRGLILEKGESQLKSGKYRFRYYDDKGVAHEVTAWRLRPTDPTPAGRQPGKSLREIEKEIRRQLDEGLKAWNGGTKVKDLVREHMDSMKPYWEANTIKDKESQYKTHIAPSAFGNKRIDKVTPEDVEQFYTELCTKKGLKVSSIGASDRIINAAFSYAVKKRMISNNPAVGALGQVRKKIGEPKTQRHALEESELDALLSFVKEKYIAWYPLFYFLAWTGCRIGEALGLSWQNVDFQREVIHITKTLEYVPIDGKCKFIWKEPKTAAGVREIPMLRDVKKILQELRPEPDKVTDINSRTKEPTFKDLVFVGIESGAPMTSANVNNALNRITAQYNKTHSEQLPDISPHIFRHSFTCWLVENFSHGENPSLLDNLKYIQKILGHSDASTTLNVYAELRKDKLEEKHETLRKAAEK